MKLFPCNVHVCFLLSAANLRMVCQGGREGVEAEWESTEEFHELWKMKSRDMLARAEWRRRKLTKRVCE